WDGNRSGMDYYYLTGIEEPGGALIVAPTWKPWPEQLYLAVHNEERERVTGERAILPSKALEVSTGIAKIARAAGLPMALLEACAHAGGLVFVGNLRPPTLGREEEDRGQAPTAFELLRRTRERTFGCAVKDLHGSLARMREVKSPEELALMRKAISYTAAGHAAALAAVRPGVREFDVQDAIADAFRRAGARPLSYDSITGSGPNGAVLHYPKDNRAMKDGELIVIDAAAEAEYYASDVTRTLPVGGKYSKEQREIYDVVLRA